MAEETKNGKKAVTLDLSDHQPDSGSSCDRGCTISIVSNQSSIAEKKTELEQVQKQIDDLTADNEDLQRILESGDIDGYMERLAREEYNYAYPDEYRFYDTSRN